HGVGGALIPVGRLVGLLGRQDFDEAAAKRIELVGIGNVAMQTDAEELRQHVDAIAAAVDTVADGDIDEPILAGNRDGWLAAQLGQRVKPGAAAAAENEAED